MEFEFWPAVLAGLAGGAVMSAMVTVMRNAGKTSLDMALLQGAMFTGDRDKAKAAGLLIHLVVMSALVFGSIYALLFSVFDVEPGDAWWVGALIGLVHGAVAGVAMGMVHMVHPRMRATIGARPAPSDGIELAPPGPFGKNYGSATPPGVLMAHALGVAPARLGGRMSTAGG